jgi:hypothetical protein
MPSILQRQQKFENSDIYFFLLKFRIQISQINWMERKGRKRKKSKMELEKEKTSSI